MKSVGRFEFSRQDLIGHGSFAVVFKGRHKEKHDLEVAVKCISKKNLAKSQSLLTKEIKILKELKHENIVGLLDCQEAGGSLYLVMEYCNGGDLAEYLQSNVTLSESTIRMFLRQIAKAMKVLQTKGIIHRDLKPQNILLCHPDGCKRRPKNAIIKIADFGFARHLRTNMMAGTLCGSPLYMAPEVIMSQQYDAKADLWSIGTIVYQCLTGKAPFQANTPQELCRLYESSKTLYPRVPKGTSSELTHLLLGLLQRNHRERISFEQFFHHPFLISSSSSKRNSPVPMPSFPSSTIGSLVSTSHLPSTLHSNEALQRLQPKENPSPRDRRTSRDGGKLDSEEEYVIVPSQRYRNWCQFGPRLYDQTCSGFAVLADIPPAPAPPALKRPQSSPLLHTPSKPVCSEPAVFVGPIWSRAVPIPVPSQVQNYQRMEEKLYSFRASPCSGNSSSITSSSSSSSSSPQCGRCTVQAFPRHNLMLTTGGAHPQSSSPTVGLTPKAEQTIPHGGTVTGQAAVMLDPQGQPRALNRARTDSDLRSLVPVGSPRHDLSGRSANRRGPFKRTLSAGRLSHMLLKAAYGTELFEMGSDDSLNSEKSMEATAPPCGFHGGLQVSPCQPRATFTMGSPTNGDSPLGFPVGSPRHAGSPCISHRLLRGGSRRNSETETMCATPDFTLVFHPPELPEDTLMERSHADALTDLRFTLAFVHCVMELAVSKNQDMCATLSPDISFLEQSLVADQISLLSRDWSCAEQLVLYMKAEECLSSALRIAKESISQGELTPSTPVKQEVRKLNEMYKSCVRHCRSLSRRLEAFLLDKQKLMDHFKGLSAEKLLYSHAVHMVQSAALDEMFHCGSASVQRYHKALVLMEGLSRIITEQKDIDRIDNCKQCIEHRLSSLQD
ncbi:serine/threonine-protein kinase ULK1a [Nelusetta ayraudi]|uniref:serine/threonine-protein kinase ULK1a n=1 Tax=Nelusetta ayraudi TaxID=303726 RepID=UPI003F6F80C6